MLDALPPLETTHAYALALAALWGARGLGRRVRDARNRAIARHAEDRGATEPPSLHPLIDAARCIGCGACTHACPEGRVLGLLDGTARLIDPASCIGHGACKDVCPVSAISLVLGTPQRGVEVPVVAPSLETDVPGLYIAGELGGTGLIANAVEDGQRAIEAIARGPRSPDPTVLDVVVVGAGPAGFAASLAAKQHGLASVTLEQGAFAGTVARYPRGKLVMTRPVRIPLYGQLHARRIRKEKLLAVWTGIAKRQGIEIRNGQHVRRIIRRPWGFHIDTQSARFATRAIVLATGRRGTPRTLDVPGEDAANVAYGLAESAHYAGRRVLVVGGGDSAIEAALSLARRDDVAVTLAHRGERFDRAKPANADKLAAAEADRRLNVLREARILAIGPDSVAIEWRGRTHDLPNDDVVVCIGGRLPTELLRGVGVEIETRYGT